MLPEWFGQIRDAVLARIGDSGVDGEMLRRWGSSEVWRIRAAGSSVIVKHGTHRMRHEGTVYTALVQPLALPAPELLHLRADADAAVLVLADAGGPNLEQRPTVEGYRQAVRLLARIRMPDPGGRFPARDLTDLVPRCCRGLASARPDLAGPSEQMAAQVVTSLDRLHAAVPPAVIHGDFVAKNLVLGPAGLVAVDWPSACVSAHLGDLYSLVHEVQNVPIAKAEAITWYAQERQRLGCPPEDSLSWQYDLGGLLWTLEAICWIVEEGRHTVPDSLGWLDGLVDDMHELANGLS